MTTCEICGERLARSVEGYKNHYKRFHCVKSNFVEMPLIRPIRTSHRTKLQIVHDMEKTWGFAVYPAVKPWHCLGDR